MRECQGIISGFKILYTEYALPGSQPFYIHTCLTRFETFYVPLDFFSFPKNQYNYIGYMRNISYDYKSVDIYKYKKTQ